MCRHIPVARRVVRLGLSFADVEKLFRRFERETLIQSESRIHNID
jgi:hypothetical protein